MHVTSLPSYGGVGDFGPAAYAFVDFLHTAKQRLWQVLPLSPTGYGSSPYSALSAFAGNPLLISLEKLAQDGWIEWDRIQGLPGHEGPADFGEATRLKLPLVEEAAANFLDRATPEQRIPFQKFCNENISWLPDYAMFTVLRREFNYASWNEWPSEYAHRKHDTITSVLNERGRELAIEQAVQFFFDGQWCALRSYCTKRDIRTLGDVAIFVNYDSADVWTHPEIFELDEDRRPLRVSGVPPTTSPPPASAGATPSTNGACFRSAASIGGSPASAAPSALYDLVRLDHFRGFEAYWSIPADEETAMNGQWVKAPGGYELFEPPQAKSSVSFPFIAEDLGLITKEVDRALREFFGMPGMRILQFGFADRGGHHLPAAHRYVENTVVYTGTHDNNTTLGWWQNDATPIERANVQNYLQEIHADGEIVWAMIKAAASSVANLCIFPLQDVLHLGSEARMNTPAAGLGNWTWRYNSNALHPDFATKLAALIEMTDRDGRPVQPILDAALEATPQTR